MTKNQINNIFYFLAIMKNERNISMISPDYFIEKSNIFLGSLGNDYYISNIKTKNYIDIYCLQWKINKNNYEILNIINFVINSNFTNPINIIKNFKKFIGDIKNIPDDDLKYKVHPLLLSNLNRLLNNRYLKLLTLE